MNKIEELVAEYNKMKEEFQKKAQEAFKEVFKQFWTDHPTIEYVVWNQYTPYFNDGEPCTFSVGEISGLTKVGHEKWQEDGGWAEEYAAYTYDYTKKKYEASEGETISEEEADSCVNALNELAKLPDDIYLDMFGDHATVIATREGFSVEEFSHD